MTSRRQDPAKSAIYNPKEFRRGRTDDILAVSPALSWRHLCVLMLAATISLSLYLWHTSDAWYSLRAVSPPPSGQFEVAHLEAQGTPQAPLRIVGSRRGEHCILRLVIWHTNAPALAVFVRGGETIDARVPVGQYRGTIVCGSTWYGDRQFGPNVVQDEIEAPLAFVRSGSGQVKGMQIELTKRLGGNLRTIQK